MKVTIHRALIAAALCCLALAAASPASARPLLGSIGDDEPANNSTAGATHIPRGAGNVSRGICSLTPGDSDYFSLSVGGFVENGAGHAFVVITTPLDGPQAAHSTPDTVIEVYNHNNSLVATDDDAGTDFPPASTRGSVVRFITTGAGDYRIRVRGFNASTAGRYMITIAEVDIAEQTIFPHWVTDLEGPVPPATADVIDARSAPVVLGYASMSGPADLDFFAIDLQDRDDLTLSICTASGIVSNTWNDINPTVSILDTDGLTTLVTDTNDGASQSPGGASSGVGSTIRFRAPATGRYFIKIQNTAGSSFAACITSVLPAPALCDGDANADGTVNFTDITTVLANFGTACP